VYDFPGRKRRRQSISSSLSPRVEWEKKKGGEKKEPLLFLQFLPFVLSVSGKKIVHGLLLGNVRSRELRKKRKKREKKKRGEGGK